MPAFEDFGADFPECLIYAYAIKMAGKTAYEVLYDFQEEMIPVGWQDPSDTTPSDTIGNIILLQILSCVLKSDAKKLLKTQKDVEKEIRN